MDITQPETISVRYARTDELIGDLLRAADIWFKNSDLLKLHELIRRYRILESQNGGK